MRPIDADKLKITDTWALVEKDTENGNEADKNTFTFAPLKCVLLSDIENAPPVEPLERIGAICNENCGINRPHGKWLHPYKIDIACECSNCCMQMPITDYFNFCPNCGADMREEGKA